MADVDRAAEFYTRVFEADIVHRVEDNVVVRFDNLLWVDDVDATFAALTERGVDFLHGPTDQPWGMRNATLVDPDGHRFEIARAG